MNTETTIPQTLHDAMKHFADPESAHEFAVAFRWPGGICCPFCNSRRLGIVKSERRWNCKDCRKRFSVKTRTIFENSPLKLETWLAGMWLIASAKNGISSCEVGRALGITQKTAWFLLHRIREAMKIGSLAKSSGPVECDEIYVGGADTNRHKNKKRSGGKSGAHSHELVMGILERGNENGPSRIRAKVLPNEKNSTLQAEVHANVEPGAQVFTDGHYAYKPLSKEFKHAWVDHALTYVRGEVHTNGLENFWSLFQRMYGGTYTHVDPQHLQAYFDELAYRFNNREYNDSERFVDVLCSVSGKRLTYAELIKRGLDTMMPA
jgi:transposase-like protein